MLKNNQQGIYILHKKDTDSLTWADVCGYIKAHIDLDFIIICLGDDRYSYFNETYRVEQALEFSATRRIDLVIGGFSWFKQAVLVHENFFWCDDFMGFDFLIIRKTLYKKILNEVFDDKHIDSKLSSLTSNKVLIRPFLTSKSSQIFNIDRPTLNNQRGFQLILENLASIRTYFHSLPLPALEEIVDDFEALSIPTYVINLKKRVDRLEHLKNEFKNRSEFDLRIIEACSHKIGAVGLWNSIRKIIELASANGEEVIIICEDDHIFTEHYSKQTLLEYLIRCHVDGVELLCGGIGDFVNAVPRDENRFWIDNFISTQFLVIYQSLFEKILNEPFDESVTADGMFSKITWNKMVCFPFISVQKEFGYSDATLYYNQDNEAVELCFRSATEKFKKVQSVISRFK